MKNKKVKPDVILNLTNEQIELLRPLIDRLYGRKVPLHALIAQVYVTTSNSAQLHVKYVDGQWAKDVYSAIRREEYQCPIS